MREQIGKIAIGGDRPRIARTTVVQIAAEMTVGEEEKALHDLIMAASTRPLRHEVVILTVRTRGHFWWIYREEMTSNREGIAPQKREIDYAPRSWGILVNAVLRGLSP